MEEIEVPTEHLQEEMHLRARASEDRWHLRVALSSALLAVLAALAALLSGHDANESMMEQIKSSDKWNYYQAKSIKQSVQASQAEVLRVLGKEVPANMTASLDRYETEKEKIAEEARELAEKSAKFLKRHERFAVAVTFFQVAIGVAAIAVLTRRRRFFHVSLLFGAGGLVMVMLGALVRV